MACLDHKGASPPPMSPRISFSNDFAESHSQNLLPHRIQDSPISSDFEFTISNNSKIHQVSAADELFFKGRILPLKENPRKCTTLRDELLAGEDCEDEEGSGGIFSLKPPQCRGRWKGFLGMRKSHVGPKKSDLFAFSLQDQASNPKGILEEDSTDNVGEMEMKM